VTPELHTDDLPHWKPGETYEVGDEVQWCGYRICCMIRGRQPVNADDPWWPSPHWNLRSELKRWRVMYEQMHAEMKAKRSIR
jgi:hypothetical protein